MLTFLSVCKPNLTSPTINFSCGVEIIQIFITIDYAFSITVSKPHMMIHGKCKIACTYHKIYEKIVTEAVTSLKRQAAMFVHTHK